MSKPTAFPPDESRLPFEIPRDEPYREKIARLGQMITDRIPAKKGILTKDAPEHWGLASIVTDEMADVALKMKVRKPMTLPELVKARASLPGSWSRFCSRWPSSVCCLTIGRNRRDFHELDNWRWASMTAHRAIPPRWMRALTRTVSSVTRT